MLVKFLSPWQVGGVSSKVAEVSFVGSLVKRRSLTTKCSQLRSCSVTNLKLLRDIT